MKMLFQKLSRTQTHTDKNHHSPEQGLALVIVLMASAIAATTTIAVALRSYNSYVNGTRQSLGKRAQEAAEAGLNILVESLNEDHPEWLIEPYNGDGKWSISRTATGGCRINAKENPTTEGTSNTYSNDGTEGRYKLSKYSFKGNHLYGGVGSFEMEGEIRSSSNKLLAYAKIYQDMSIIAKPCNALPGETGDQKKLWPGILIDNKIERFVNTRAYIKGSDPMKPAIVMCTQECKGVWESDFPPEPTIGDVEKPKARKPPEGLKGLTRSEVNKLVKKTVANICTRRRDLKIPEDIPKHGKKLIDGTWHIYFKDSSSININGRSCKGKKNAAIKIQGDKPVELHLDSGLTIQSRTWIDTTEVKHAADFMILGTEKQTRDIAIRGESPDGEPLKTFIWAPNSRVYFLKAELTVEGAIWAKKLYGVGNDAIRGLDIAVPEDMPQLIYQRLGKEFGIGQRDYAAQGVTSWRSYGRTPE